MEEVISEEMARVICVCMMGFSFLKVFFPATLPVLGFGGGERRTSFSILTLALMPSI